MNYFEMKRDSPDCLVVKLLLRLQNIHIHVGINCNIHFHSYIHTLCL